jgi:uncharacterized membrane protein YphA (DoxX/SURF4 family)
MNKKQFNIPISIDFAVLLLRVVPSLLMLTHGFEKLMQVFKGNWGFADPIGLGETTGQLKYLGRGNRFTNFVEWKINLTHFTYHQV